MRIKHYVIYASLAASLTLALLKSDPALAQYEGFSAPTYVSPLTISTNYIQTVGISESLAEERRHRKNGYKERDDEDTLEQPQISYATLNYKTSLARRKLNVAQFLVRVRAQSPSTADSLQQQLTQTDIFAAINKVLVPKGLNVNNFADAQAVLWISMWEASRGLVRDGSAKETRAVRDQVLWLWHSSPEIAALTDVQKQAIAEESYLNALLIGASLVSVENDPAQLKAYANEIAKQSATIGLDLSKVTLTEDGFIAN